MELPEKSPADHNEVWCSPHNISLERCAGNIRRLNQFLYPSKGTQHPVYGSEEDPDRHKRGGCAVWLIGWLRNIQREWVGASYGASDPSNNGDENAWYKMYVTAKCINFMLIIISQTSKTF
jgi:hypothetical protein